MLVYLNLNPLSTNFTKWSNTLKQFVGKLGTNCLDVFGHFVGLALKVLTYFRWVKIQYFLLNFWVCNSIKFEIFICAFTFYCNRTRMIFCTVLLILFRSSRSEVFCQKGILRNFAKFAGKHLCQSLLFHKVAAGNFIKKRDSGTGVFL